MTTEEKGRWWQQQTVLWLIAGTLGLILGDSNPLGNLIAIVCAAMTFLSGLLTIGLALDEKSGKEGEAPDDETDDPHVRQ